MEKSDIPSKYVRACNVDVDAAKGRYLVIKDMASFKL